MTELTSRQREVLEFIRWCMRENHVPPTVREMAAEFGFSSVNGIMCHLKALVKKGELLKVGAPGGYSQYVPAKGWLTKEDANTLERNFNSPLFGMVLRYAGVTK